MVTIRHHRFTMALGAVALAAALQRPTPVQLCHRTPQGVYVTITAVGNQVQVHLNHGDTPGACPTKPSSPSR